MLLHSLLKKHFVALHCCSNMTAVNSYLLQNLKMHSQLESHVNFSVILSVIHAIKVVLLHFFFLPQRHLCIPAMYSEQPS